VEEKVKKKELKRKAKENLANEKDTRKTQKEEQKLANPHFTEFLKLKSGPG
jgi:hypothetical protein